MREEPLIGAHISIAKGLHNALITGKSIGASTVQIFTANQRMWKTKCIEEQEVELFKAAKEQTGLSHIMSHASYLINLGSPKEEVREKSIKAFGEEIERCNRLGISYMNFHPGAALDESRELCLERIVEAMLSFEGCCSDELELILETTAGQGSVVGSKFEEIGYIIDCVKSVLPVGVCLDTCHSFSAGYDLRTKEALDHTLSQFDEVIGLKYLRALHLNDSRHGLGERKDRHMPIGDGMIGKSGFSAIMQAPELKLLPKYLETPGGLEVWEEEIRWLKHQIPSR